MTGEIEPYTRIRKLGPDQWAVSTHVDLLERVLAEIREQRGIVAKSAVLPVPGMPDRVRLTVHTLPEVQRQHVPLPRRGTNPYLVAASVGGGVTAVGVVAWLVVAHLAVVAVVVAVIALVGTRRPVRRCITRITVEHRH